MEAEHDFGKGKRGAIAPVTTGKTRVTIRLDNDVLEWFRTQVHAAGGGNYQSLINFALREHMKRTAEPLEETLRRILREEFLREPTHVGRGRRKVPTKGTVRIRNLSTRQPHRSGR